MAESKIVSSNFTVICYTKTLTTGTTSYDGFYYAELNLNPPTQYTPLGVLLSKTVQNKFAVVQYLPDYNQYRIWSKSSGVTATFKVYFIKSASVENRS